MKKGDSHLTLLTFGYLVRETILCNMLFVRGLGRSWFKSYEKKKIVLVTLRSLRYKQVRSTSLQFSYLKTETSSEMGFLRPNSRNLPLGINLTQPNLAEPSHTLTRHIRIAIPFKCICNFIFSHLHSSKCNTTCTIFFFS